MFEQTAAMDRINEMFEQYVPASGAAETVGGEIVRAISRVGYRWWNDGDKLGVGYGNETCNAAGRYLADKCDKDVGAVIASMWGCESDEVYDACLTILEDALVKFLDENPELFEEVNTKDMWSYRLYEDLHYDDEEEEYWEEESWEEEEDEEC